MTTTSITQENFQALDFWYNTVGVNVHPADTMNKRVSKNWKPKQDITMEIYEFETLKAENAFIRGAAVITGKAWRGKHLGYYLIGIDLDNQKAIEELLLRIGSEMTLEMLADRTLIEQHPDHPTRLHLYV